MKIFSEIRCIYASCTHITIIIAKNSNQMLSVIDACFRKWVFRKLKCMLGKERTVDSRYLKGLWRRNHHFHGQLKNTETFCEGSFFKLVFSLHKTLDKKLERAPRVVEVTGPLTLLYFSYFTLTNRVVFFIKWRIAGRRNAFEVKISDFESPVMGWKVTAKYWSAYTLPS